MKAMELPARAPAVKPEPRPAITTIAIPTARRPAELARCVESYAAHQARFGRSARVLIVDDSTDRATLATTARTAAVVAERYGVRVDHVTRAAKDAYAARLARETGVAVELLRFALLGHDALPGGPGANRNAILLAAPDELLLSVDDDTLCRVHPAPTAHRPPCSVDSRRDPRAFTFFRTRAEALAARADDSADVLARHERWLGAPLHAALPDWEDPQSVDLAQASPTAFADLRHQRGRVRLTLNGVVGRSAWKWPGRYLRMEEGWSAQLLGSEDLYRDAIRTQALAAIAPRTTLSDAAYFSAMFFGLDNCGPRPPFLPVLRSQDVLFGDVLRKSLPGTYSAHLPWALEHDPIEARDVDPELVGTHAGLELSTFLSSRVGRLGRRDVGFAPTLRALGADLRGLAEGSAADFEYALRDLVREWAAFRAADLEQRLRVQPDAPAYWTRDVQRNLAAMRAAAHDVDGALPHDIPRRGPAGWQLAREVVSCFGRLLEAWDDVLAGARRLHARGEGLTP
jgi:hypothetical protein